MALAQWFDERFPPLVEHRTYARLSRRQSSTPDIPRAHWTVEELDRRTFGVVLDTSGSMDRYLLGKALGAIASYGAARDVSVARLVFCDAQAYDEGYVPIEEIATRVRVTAAAVRCCSRASSCCNRRVTFRKTARSW